MRGRRPSGCATACLRAFDLLHLGADDVRPLTLAERRALLTEASEARRRRDPLYEHLDGADGEAMFRHACAMGLEGIVSKRVDGRYKSGR
jgi:bifunctional non-homologous end joining protein LigD